MGQRPKRETSWLNIILAEKLRSFTLEPLEHYNYTIALSLHTNQLNFV